MGHSSTGLMHARERLCGAALLLFLGTSVACSSQSGSGGGKGGESSQNADAARTDQIAQGSSTTGDVIQGLKVEPTPLDKSSNGYGTIGPATTQTQGSTNPDPSQPASPPAPLPAVGALQSNPPVAPKLAYTGRELAYTCGSEPAGHLAVQYAHRRFLARFEGSGSFLKQVIGSLEASDPAEVKAPKTAILPGISARLGAAASDPDRWVLNLVRIRGDQLKLNYELDQRMTPEVVSGQVDFAAIIYSIAILPGDLVEYRDDVLAIGHDPDNRGCNLARFLTKWIARGSFFFAHTNVFDKTPGSTAWRFAEMKVHQSGVQVGPYEHLADKPYASRELALVKMRFPYLEWNPATRTIAESTDAYEAWSSDESSDLTVDLIKPVGGQALAKDHIARQDDRAYTCNQCHNRTFATRGDAGSGRLTLLPFTFSFRMVGFGFEPEMGIPGVHNRADFAPVFRDILARDAAHFAGAR